MNGKIIDIYIESQREKLLDKWVPVDYNNGNLDENGEPIDLQKPFRIRNDYPSGNQRTLEIGSNLQKMMKLRGETINKNGQIISDKYNDH